MRLSTFCGLRRDQEQVLSVCHVCRKTNKWRNKYIGGKKLESKVNNNDKIKNVNKNDNIKIIYKKITTKTIKKISDKNYIKKL